MKDLLDKLISYNIFNYLLPGVLLAVIVSAITSFKLLQDDLLTSAFVYYFLGAVVSRVGSLIVEPAMKRYGFISFAPYDDYVSASKNDPKLEILSETNNMYRTLCALILLVTVVYLYDLASRYHPFFKTLVPAMVILLLLALFLASYKKQTAYIVKRVSLSKQRSS